MTVTIFLFILMLAFHGLLFGFLFLIFSSSNQYEEYMNQYEEYMNQYEKLKAQQNQWLQEIRKSNEEFQAKQKD